MDVPGVRPRDIEARLEHGGRILHVTGSTKVNQTSEDGTTTTVIDSKFEKWFTMDRSVSPQEVKAKLEDEVLIITAPKVCTREEVLSEVLESPREDSFKIIITHSDPTD